MSGLSSHLRELNGDTPRTEGQQRALDEAKDVLRHAVENPGDFDALIWIVACGCGGCAGDEWITRELMRLYRQAIRDDTR